LAGIEKSTKVAEAMFGGRQGDASLIEEASAASARTSAAF
jgi:hypothetical protein